MGTEKAAYSNARARCQNSKDPHWPNYGGRGIEFRFRDFASFFAELGPRPEGLVLDRKENSGHYEPGNVRWTTRSESSRNQRRPVVAPRLSPGQRFGKLTVIEEAGRDSHRHLLYRCQCDCGNETVQQGFNLQHRVVVSCGCLSTKFRSRAMREFWQHWREIRDAEAVAVAEV